MRKKTGNGTEESEAEKEKEPTVEAAGKEEVKAEEVVAEEQGQDVLEEKDVEVLEEKADEAPDKEEPKKEKVISAGKGPNKPKKRMFKIMIADQDGHDNGDVFVTDPSDGVPFQIMRGQEVTVPIGVVNNLKESIQGKLSYDNAGNEVWKDVNRFAMTILGEVK